VTTSVCFILKIADRVTLILPSTHRCAAWQRRIRSSHRNLSTSLITNTELVAESDPCNFETPPKKPNSRSPHARGQTSAFPQEQTQNNCEVAATITTFRKMHMRHEISYRGIQFLVPESLCSPSYEGSKFTFPTARFRKNVNIEYHDL
jgi:hypothetical protein